MATTYTKLIGAPGASSLYNDFGTTESIADGNPATGWSGGQPYSTLDFVGYTYTAAQKVRKIEMYVHTFGKTIVVGVAPGGWSANRSNFTVVRTIDVTVTPNDDLGVPWARFTTNTILLPADVIDGLAIAIWTTDTAVNPLGNGSSGVDRLRVMELTTYSGVDDGPPPSTLKKINNGAVFAYTTYTSSSSISVTDDGVLGTTFWEGNGANNVSYTDFLGRLFTMPIKVKQIKIQFYRWSRYIRIGYAQGQPSNKTGFTLIREIDTKTQTVDDAGVAWSTWAQRPNGAFHTINVPDYPASLAIGIYQGDTAEGGPISDNVPAGNNSRVGAYEAQYFNDGDTLPNPKPPSTVPVLPFSATPANWTRTEFKTPGTFNFTPAADTTLVLAIAVGGGAGGRINYNRVGSTQTPNSGFGGGHAVVANSKGVLLRARGGQDFAIPPEIDAAQYSFEMNWLRYVDSGGTAGAARSVGNTTSAPGGRGAMTTGVAGATFTFQTQDLNSGFGATNRLDTTNMPTPPVGIALDGFVRNTGGIVSMMQTGESGSAGFTFNAVTGQALTIVFGRNSTTYAGAIRIYVNDVYIGGDSTTGWVGTKSINYTVTEDGPLKLELRHTSANGGSQVTFDRFTISTVNYGPSQSGASGRLGQLYMLPEPLTLTVPAGGKGIKGDHNYLTNAQNGALGGGGAAGGDGGDGVIYIYEYKGGLVNDQQPNPIFANYNSLTLDTGVYRTQYSSNVGIITGKKDLVHYLRPKTKSIIVIMTGQGGRSTIGTGAQDSEQWLPTTLTYGAKSFVAQAGWTGRYLGQSTGYGGNGGDFITSEEVVTSGTGNAGGNTSNSTPNPSLIAGGFGTGGSSGYLSTGGGGCGGYGMFVLDALPNDRTIEISIGDAYASTFAGAVFIYETELPIPVTVTQVAELVLQKEPVGPTQVTQAAQLVLQKEPIGPSRVTQTVMMVLLREPKSTTVAVTESYIDVVTPAERGSTRVSQSVQSVLIESDPIDQNVTQVAALVLVREIPTLLEKMDFGVMRYPEKYTLYLSDIKTVTGIGAGNELRLQLEGDLPEGSTLIINGVDIQALTVMVKDGDTVQLKSGIMNYFITRHTVYAYVSRQDQIVREIAGWWSILQADLSPRKRATIGVVGKFVGMLVAKANTIISKPLTARKAATIGALAPKQTALKTEALDVKGAVQLPTKAATIGVPFNSAGTQVAKQDTILSGTKTFMRSSVESVLWLSDLWLNAGTPKTIAWDQKKALANAGPTFSKGEVRYRASVSPGASKTRIGVELGAKAAQANADQKYTNAFAGGSAIWTMLEFEVAGEQATIFARTAYVYAPTVVFSNIELVEFTTQERDKVTYFSPPWKKVEELGDVKSTPVWHTPPKDFGVVAKAINAIGAVAAHIHLWGKNDWVARPASPQPGRDREFATIQYGVGSGATQSWQHRVNSQTLAPKSTYSVVKRNATLIPVGYKVAKANATLFGMKPMLYQAGKNKISAAKYYMGFTTKAEVDAFIVNFLKPTTKTKLDGWVYRVGVDETLVCEVRGPNMPIAWLMHGG